MSGYTYRDPQRATPRPRRPLRPLSPELFAALSPQELQLRRAMWAQMVRLLGRDHEARYHGPGRARALSDALTANGQQEARTA